MISGNELPKTVCKAKLYLTVINALVQKRKYLSKNLNGKNGSLGIDEVLIKEKEKNLRK